MMYDLNTVALTKRQKAELQMPKSSLGVTRVKNQYFRETVQVQCKVREARVTVWTCAEGQRIYCTKDVEDRAATQTTEKIHGYAVKEELERVGVTEEDIRESGGDGDR